MYLLAPNSILPCIVGDLHWNGFHSWLDPSAIWSSSPTSSLQLFRQMGWHLWWQCRGRVNEGILKSVEMQPYHRLCNVKHSVKQCKYTTALQLSLLVLLRHHVVYSFYFLQSDILTSLIFAEDEQQQKTLSCSKSVRQLTIERDQAIADLNSVERSFADLFRRYENMKGVLEGFKKVGRASVWLSWDASVPTTS